MARGRSNNLRYADDTTLMAESEEELKSLLMEVNEDSEKAGLKLNIQKTKIMASGPISSVQFSSVAQLCPTLCDPMNHSMPGLPVHHQLPEFTSPISSWQIEEETIETGTDFIFLGSKITADSDCSHEIKRSLLLGRKALTNLNSIFKGRDITLTRKLHLVNAMVFPVVMYGCES